MPKQNLQPSQRKASLMGKIVLLFLCVGAGYVGGVVGSQNSQGGSLANQTTETRQQIVSSESELIAQLVKDVGPSVVSVNVTSRTTSFFGEYQSAGAGTGIIIRDDGTIMTNRHVIDGVNEVSVTLEDGTELPATVIDVDSANDVGFIKVTDLKGKTLKAAKLGDSSTMEVGDKVVAIGNALGEFQNTVTTGIISGVGRPITAGSLNDSEDLTNLFQTDAAINQGNSGGPLVNLSGEVIAMNTAVAGNGAENIGFAIPVNDTKGLIDSILAKGKIVRPYLGVRYITITAEFAKQNNLAAEQGAYIPVSSATSGGTVVLPGSPAEKAGLKGGDIIVKVNETALTEKTTLVSAVGQLQVGQEVKLTIIRGGNEQVLTATLAESDQ